MGKYSFARGKSKKFNSFASQQSTLQKRAFSVAKPENTSRSSSEKTPDLQTQLQRATRQGHNLSRLTQSYQQSALQTKLAIGEVGDVYEKEADRIAEQVVNQPQPLQKEQQTENLQQKPLQRQATMPEEEEEKLQTKPLQRQAAMPEEEEEKLQTKPLQRQAAMPEEEEEKLQTKPLQRQAAMPEEEEEKLQTKPLQRQAAMPEEEEEKLQTKPLQRQAAMPEEEEEKLQTKPLQRQAAMPEEEEEKLQTKPLQRQAAMPEEEEEMAQAKASGDPLRRSESPASASSGNTDVTSLETQLANSKGGGNPLSEETRNYMEPRFGADFSQVKVHDNSNAASMNRSIQAQAFTQGQDIYFNSGKYDPNSSSGKKLLAHELTHVLQQKRGGN